MKKSTSDGNQSGPAKRAHLTLVEPCGPTPEALTHAQIAWIKPLRYERGEPVARKEGMHVRLLIAERIERAHYDWCEAYCRAIEALHGARPGKPDYEFIDEMIGSQAIYDRATKAASFVRRAHAGLNPRQRALLMSAVVLAHRVCDVAIAIGIYPDDDETMAEFVRRVERKISRYVVVAIIAGSGIKPKSEQPSTSY
jgi:hypothetical protein